MKNEEAAVAADALLRAQAGVNGGAQFDGEDPALIDGFEEIEHEGQFYKIPVALKGAFLMNADYTRKTQELAEHRRALEQGRQELVRRAEAAQSSLQDRARLVALNDQLADFERVDWQAYSAHDPESAQSLWAHYQAMSQTRDQYVHALQHQEQQAQLAAQRQQAEEMVRAGEVLSREIDGWSPEVANKLVEYAGAFGVTLDELRSVADPRLWKILHRAFAGDQLQKQQSAARNTAQMQAVRPAVHVSGSAPVGGAVRDDLATGEWMRRRNEQALRAR
jgi:hypothetical protein